jgi:hypothetical protein
MSISVFLRSSIAVRSRSLIGGRLKEGPSAGVAYSGNAVVGFRPWSSSSAILPIALIDICTIGLRVLRWACLEARLFFLPQRRRQVVQSRLPMARWRRKKLSNMYRRSQSCAGGRFHEWTGQHDRQQEDDRDQWADWHGFTLRLLRV